MIKSRQILFYFLIFSGLSLLFIGCSTQSNKAINRGFHNIHARYNGYFNAKESMKEAAYMLENAYKDDYNKLLPIYIYGDEESVQSIFPQMERSVEKTAVVIAKHSMVFDGEEYCKWIDDNWLLMGQARFFKQEYEKADSIFTYTLQAYEGRKLYHWTELWLAKTYIEQERYERAKTFLNRLENKAHELEASKVKEDPTGIKEYKKDKKSSSKSKKKSKKRKSKKRKSSKKKKSSRKKSSKKKKSDDEEISEEPVFNKDVQIHFRCAYADFYIRKQEYDKAIEQLIKAIELKPNKKFLTRITFILGQLYKKEGNTEDAIAQFDKVIKHLRPTYEMEFYSKINIAFSASGSSSSEIKETLLKMTKDIKNEEYYDQIFYALADIELREGNEPLAIEYLKKSTQLSMNNDRQKGVSYLVLGNLNFDDRNYVMAQAYYDSSSTYLPKEYENYESVLAKSKSLDQLVKDLNIISREDSLQGVAQMDSSDMISYIQELIEKKREEEKLLKEQLDNMAMTSNTNGSKDGSKTSGYFGNLAAMGQGFSEFKRIWGNRKLEDDWRRSNKKSVDFDSFNSPEEEEEVVDGEISQKEIEKYLTGLPLKPEQMKASDKMIVDAMYDASVVYKEKLYDNDAAIESFEELLKRFPESEYTYRVYYQLYLLYKKVNNQNSSNKYKSKLLAECPQCEETKLILNPNYLEDKAKAEEVYEEAYMQAYYDLKNRKYHVVISKCDTVISKEPENKYLPKYYLLKAMSLGELGDLDNYINTLKALVKKYPETEAGERGKELLNALKNRNRKKVNSTKPKAPFIFDPASQHMFVFILDDVTVEGDLKTRISNFNKAYFKSEPLKISSIKFGDKQMVVVKSFNDSDKALKYFRAFKQDKGIVNRFNQKEEFFVISRKNYSVLYSQKNDLDYIEFYKENYKLKSK